MNGLQVAAIAKSYVGITETPNNSGFKDKTFEKKIKEVGWSKSMAWCSYFGELVWKEAYHINAEIVKRIDELCNGSATATYKNFDVNQLFECNAEVPKVGAMMVFRYGSDWKGHLCIVVQILGENEVLCVEGNSNDDGAREGYEVCLRKRKIKDKYKAKGLNLVGFIYPPSLIAKTN